MAFIYEKNNDKSITVRDPIHGEYNIPYPFSAIILTKEMQRLEDITQNGLIQYKFTGLKKNERLSHSVGTYFIMTKILKKVDELLSNYGLQIDEKDKNLALCSMLLHDIGHGPFSHSLENISQYSHEQRTVDIITGNTEVGNLLRELYGDEETYRISSFISGDYNNNSNNFTQLLKKLVSSQLDSDRMDYLIRDSYYANLPSAISLDAIIDSINIKINENNQYELFINRSGMSAVELLYIRRYQLYRDVYLSSFSTLGDIVLENIMRKLRENPEELNLPISNTLRKLAIDPNVENLDDFLLMGNKDVLESFEILKNNSSNPIIRYLCNLDNLEDYILLNNDTTIEEIEEQLRYVFLDVDLSKSISVFMKKVIITLYKKGQGLNVQYGNKVEDITECSGLIDCNNKLTKNYLYFNPKLLMLELGLDYEENKKQLDKVIEMLDRNPEEFKLKYLVSENEDKSKLVDRLLEIFCTMGFKIESMKPIFNDDYYFDDKDFSLFNEGASIRTRKSKACQREKSSWSFKSSSNSGEVYSSRHQLKSSTKDNSFESLAEKIKNCQIPIDLSQLLENPLLNARNNRINIILERDGAKISLSIDFIEYINCLLGKDFAYKESTIEIEALGNFDERVILNEIHSALSEGISSLKLDKQSKYERGLEGTTMMYLAKGNPDTTIMTRIDPLIKKIKEVD